MEKRQRYRSLLVNGSSERGGTGTEVTEQRATSLGELVRTRAEMRHMSLRNVAREANVSIATVSKIVNGQLTHMPGPRVLDGLAQALAVNVLVLRDAAAADLGVREFVVSEGTKRAIYLALDDLSDDEQQAVWQIVETIRRGHHGQNGNP